MQAVLYMGSAAHPDLWLAAGVVTLQPSSQNIMCDLNASATQSIFTCPVLVFVRVVVCLHVAVQKHPNEPDLSRPVQLCLMLLNILR